MPRGPGQLIKLHKKIEDFTCLCCAPTPPKKILMPDDDGT